MQSDDINKRKIITSVEIVDIPPPTDKEAPFKADDEPAGTTKLSKEELQLLFQGRNLAFIATLLKDGSPHVTPVCGPTPIDSSLSTSVGSGGFSGLPIIA